MSETTKTLIFVLCGVFAVSAAVLGRPGRVGVETPDLVGQPLFADFTDPEAAESLTVVEADELGTALTTFEVAKKNGVWVIPSHQDYPADATENLQAAATMFIDLTVLNVASDEVKDHATYGVLDTTEENAAAADEDMGKLVRLQDAKGKRLVELLIGKPVKGQDEQRYVRIPKQNRVYTVKINPDNLSTKFQDWIEQDVLALNPIDIEQMVIFDYSVAPTLTADGRIRPELEERSRVRVRWNADDAQWELQELSEAGPDGLRSTQLLENEGLDKARLDEMKNKLADLKIIDVNAKPDGLRRGLQGGEDVLWQDREGAQSLIGRGFYPRPNTDGSLGIASTDGEVTVITKEGVNYTLRFGQVAGAETEGDESKLNRYVMITASVDDASFPRPELEEVPEPAGPAEPDMSATTDAQPEDTSASVDPSESLDAASSESETSETAAAEQAERDRIITENQRKLDEYAEKKKKAQDKVDELNLRFADWYYVISEDVYKDIHLAGVDVIETQEGTAEEGFGIDAFRKLEDEGLKREGAEPEQPAPLR